MAINLKLFNRIINLKFYRKVGNPIELKCPVKGRKPNIQIHAEMLTSSDIPAFNLTIKNLYLDLKNDVFTKLEVDAGYEGKLATIEGTIIQIYQEEPGPEGTVYIQCKEGSMKEWLDVFINVSFEAGTPLPTVIEKIKQNLKVSGVHFGKTAGLLTLKDRFEHNGSARDAIAKLKKIFQDQNLVIFLRNGILTSLCLNNADYANIRTLEYMSAPPQFNTAGDSSGTYNVTITAPWVPDLQPGDLLIVPSIIYQTYGSIVGSLTGTQKIQVQNISYHFGTTGGTNSMTVQGYLVH